MCCATLASECEVEGGVRAEWKEGGVWGKEEWGWEGGVGVKGVKRYRGEEGARPWPVSPEGLGQRGMQDKGITRHHSCRHNLEFQLDFS